MSERADTSQVIEGAPRWVSRADAARYLGIDPRTLIRLVNDGHLRAYKIGNAIRFRLDDLEAYVDEALIQPGSLL